MPSSRELALQMKEAFERLSPYIERHTGEVCPFCVKVCCANKHGTPEAQDFFFFGSLGIEAVPAQGPADAVCSLLSAAGCTLPRWQRPFRCTWYFCGPLLEAMRNGSGREYRAFVSELERLVGLRRELLEKQKTP
ncbi:MAG: hypothetical protein M0Z59_10830 [Nitrospiraceae bacterium]|nr:hypothetical protein [Nitrospiraceae bacterium]